MALEKTLPIVTVTGPTCAGKTTLVRRMLAHSDGSNLAFSEIVSHTTRAPRVNEKDGVDYYFVTANEFETISRTGGFAESVTFNNVRYGSSRKEIDAKLQHNKIPLVIVEPNGASQFADFCAISSIPLISVFIDVKRDVAVERLFARDEKQKAIDRLSSIFNDEASWFTRRKWDIIIPSYCENNVDDVPAELSNLIATVTRARNKGVVLHFNDNYYTQLTTNK